MIILMVGGVGTGKTISAVHEILTANQFAITNFKLKNYKNYYRLKLEDILIYQDMGKKKENIVPVGVNWDFWDKIRKKHKAFSIFIDEIHNLIHSRASMSKRNQLMSKWVSQIRKITSDSETNHLFLISQKIRKIDVDFRELAHLIVECKKKIVKRGKNKGVWIIKTWYAGIENYNAGRKIKTTYFYANPLFKYYNTKEIIDFGESEIYA